jgi:hypothetical protein
MNVDEGLNGHSEVYFEWQWDTFLAPHSAYSIFSLHIEGNTRSLEIQVFALLRYFRQAMSRYNSTTQDSVAVVGHYTVYTGRHGRAMLVPYYHGEANEQSPAQREVAAPTGFRRETGLGYSGKLVNRTRKMVLNVYDLVYGCRRRIKNGTSIRRVITPHQFFFNFHFEILPGYFPHSYRLPKCISLRTSAS